MILAGIDIGTNTIRMLIADIGVDGFREVVSGRVVTRLGQDLDQTGLLSPGAQERSLIVLSEFSRIISSNASVAASAVGTSALRNAGNAGQFIASVKERTGLDVRIITGDEEARLTLLGVRRALSAGRGSVDDPLASALVVDIGGGSTELIVTSNGSVAHVQSLRLGAVYLTDRHFKQDPPAAGELGALRSTVRQELDEWARDLTGKGTLPPAGLGKLAGTAGTITTLAAMDQQLDHYDPERINGYVLERSSLDRMVREISSMTLEQRRNLAGLEAGREDIILAGAIICQEIMERCGNRELLVSDWGLREGIVLDAYERTRKA